LQTYVITKYKNIFEQAKKVPPEDGAISTEKCRRKVDY